MHNLEKSHLDVIKFEQETDVNSEGIYKEFVESSNYYNVAVESSKITKIFSIEFAKFCLEKTKDFESNADIVSSNI